MTSVREEWLALTKEDPIEPGLPICDPHHHLWGRPDHRYTAWNRPTDHYLVNDLLQDIAGGHNIVQTVFLECGSMYRTDGPPEMRPVGETEFVEAIVAQNLTRQPGTPDIAAGIVGFADLTLGAAVAPVLEAHIAAGRSRFRGIRQSCTWHPNPDIPRHGKFEGMMSDRKFREGFACLRNYGLSFDSWQYHTQLMELVELARAFPDTPIIVNHAGGLLGTGPYAHRREEALLEWKRGMTALATCPNVVVKLGGLGMPRYGFGWHSGAKPPSSTELAEAMAPYYRWCIEEFGSGRCMFESNFPVDKVSYSYTILWNALKLLTEDYSTEERSALFHDTAARVYRLATAREIRESK